jgi:hypothetical protein
VEVHWSSFPNVDA